MRIPPRTSSLSEIRRTITRSWRGLMLVAIVLFLSSLWLIWGEARNKRSCRRPLWAKWRLVGLPGLLLLDTVLLVLLLLTADFPLGCFLSIQPDAFDDR